MDCGAKDLTVVNNNAGQGDQGLALLIKEGRVKKMICSFSPAVRLLALRRQAPRRRD
jgi:acyl CoA:acetate/3-ketoacid CoA transferase alpha subunit